MYTASQYEFRRFPDIRRNFPSPTLKTEDAPTRWLNGELMSGNDKCPLACLGRRIVQVILALLANTRFRPLNR